MQGPLSPEEGEVEAEGEAEEAVVEHPHLPNLEAMAVPHLYFPRPQRGPHPHHQLWMEEFLGYLRQGEEALPRLMEEALPRLMEEGLLR